MRSSEQRKESSFPVVGRFRKRRKDCRQEMEGTTGRDNVVYSASIMFIKAESNQISSFSSFLFLSPSLDVFVISSSESFQDKSAAAAPAEGTKDKTPTIEQLAAQIASLQAAAVTPAAAAATTPHYPNSAENWHSPGDIGLLPTLLIITFVIGSIFLVSWVGQRQGWWIRLGLVKPSGKSGSDARYEMLPRHVDD